MNSTHKFFICILISLISLSSSMAQTQYWDKYFNKSNKRKAYYYSTDKVIDNERHIEYFQVSTGQKYKTVRYSFGTNRRLLGEEQYSYWENGKVRAHHIFTITSGRPRKTTTNFRKKADMSPRFQYTTDFIYYYSNGNKKFHKAFDKELNSYATTSWKSDKKEITDRTHIPGIDESVAVDEEPYPLNIDIVKKSVGYPVSARDRGIQGQVVVRVLVDEKGNTQEYKVVNLVHPFLANCVEMYALDLKFSPALKEGKPVMFWVNIPFNFKLLN